MDAFGVRLPRLQLATVVFRLWVFAKQKVSHIGSFEHFFTFLARQILIDIVKDFILGESSTLSHSSFQLVKRNFGIPKTDEKGLVNKSDTSL